MSFRHQAPSSQTKSGDTYGDESDSCERNKFYSKRRENDFESDSEESIHSDELKLQSKT